MQQTAQQTQQNDPLHQELYKQLEELRSRSQINYDNLVGALYEWGSITKCAGLPTLYDAIKSQIEFQAKKKGCDEKQFVNYLFSQRGYEDWMLAFQL